MVAKLNQDNHKATKLKQSVKKTICLLLHMPNKKDHLMKSYYYAITAITGFSTEKVHNVTFNTINFDPLIHPSIQRHDDYD